MNKQQANRIEDISNELQSIAQQFTLAASVRDNELSESIYRKLAEKRKELRDLLDSLVSA